MVGHLRLLYGKKKEEYPRGYGDMFSSGSVNWRITGAYSTPPRVKR